MTKTECEARLNVIVENSITYDYCEFVIKCNDWKNYGKDRTYFSIVEKSTNPKASKHYREKNFGYIDNLTGEYFPAKYGDLTKNYTFGGSSF